MSSPLDLLRPQSIYTPSLWSGGLRNHHRSLLSPPPLPPPPTKPFRCRTSVHILPCVAAGNFFPLRNPTAPPDNLREVATYAGRSKKKPGGQSPGRIEGNAEVRRQAKENARRRSRRLSQNRFFRRNNPSAVNQADSFTDEELEMIGLGYDRWVRFMAPDDPNLRHPHDWYKYGNYGPYSWRGIVVGPPIRGRFSDERVSLISEVDNHEEWERIEQFDMSSEYTERVRILEESKIGMRYFWVFVRHPKWRAAELPWQQWTLVAEVAVEASPQQRLDKWSLMGRFGNQTRAMITQCAAWMRPDIIYVKRPVYQCRFEPQDDFFKLLGPLVNPETEHQHLCELRSDEGRVELCTYFAGLCKIVKIGQKAYVDDIVNAYEKLSDESKSRCLDFLLNNHPMELLHPYTKEWKAKLEEMELGCDAPDESDSEVSDENNEIIDWIEDDGSDGDAYAVAEEAENEEDDNDGDEYAVAEEAENKEDDNDEELAADSDPEESKEYWDEQWKKAVRSSDAMEKLVKKSIEISNKFYEKHNIDDNQKEKEDLKDGIGSTVLGPDQRKDELQKVFYKGRKRIIKTSRIPPELFLRAGVRPFTYRNLVKEIVLLRHAIIDGDVSVDG